MFFKLIIKKYILLNFFFYKSLKSIINLVSKLRFDLPKKNKYLIIDQHSKTLIKIFNISKNCSILKTRKEEFYFWIILSSLKRLNSLKLSELYKAYLKTYISYVRPQLVLTYIHNNEILWDICKEINSDFYIFQNGYCSPTDPLPKNYNTSKNSIFFTLTKERSKILERNGVKSITFGSLQSNSIPKLQSNIKKRIIFISQFRNLNSFEKKKFNLNQLSYNQCFSYDYDLLEIVYKFSKIFNMELIFLGSSTDENHIKNEKKFFNIKYKKVKFKKKFSSLKKRFQFLDSSYMVIGMDSALLYECLGRNIKTFFCTSRGYKEFNYSVRPFLESLSNDGYGEFWTNKYNEDLILNILTDMHLKSSKSKSTKKLYEQVPYYNPINLQIIKKLINDSKNK